MLEYIYGYVACNMIQSKSIIALRSTGFAGDAAFTQYLMI